MTKLGLTRFLDSHNLCHVERYLPKSIEIEVYAPPGYRFIEGPHTRVFHWLSGAMGELRFIVADELENCTLVICSADCVCRDDD